MIILMAVFQLFNVDDLRFQSDWYDRAEYWRIVSAHWIHLNWKHWLLNSAGLLLCMGIASPNWVIWQWISYQLVLAIGISLLFTLFNHGLHWYVGYSGVLFGLFILAGLNLFARERMIAVLLVGGIIAKIVLEQSSNLTVTTSEFIGSAVIIDAHLYGVIIAFAIALVSHGYTIWARTGNRHSEE